jgi:hypothetical protein
MAAERIRTHVRDDNAGLAGEGRYLRR